MKGEVEEEEEMKVGIGVAGGNEVNGEGRG